MVTSFQNGYALIIGVGYRDKPGWVLPETVNDAVAIEGILTDPNHCAYDSKQVHLLCDEEATRANILQGLDWLATVNPDATILVFYSGHGFLHDRQGYFLVPYDTQFISTNINNGLAAEDFAKKLQKIRPQRLFVILDCCYAGGMATSKGKQLETIIPSQYKQVPYPEEQARLLGQGKGRAVFMSSTGDEPSYVRSEGDFSIYTYHLVEALKGAGNQVGDKDVRLSNLMYYLSKSVPASARLCQHEQTPFFDMHGGDFPVALIRGGRGISEVKTKESTMVEKPFVIPPGRPVPFIGRLEELQRLHKELQEERHMLLSGMGGVGKTCLALEYAHRYYQDQFVYTDGVFLLNATEKVNDLTSSLNELADRAGVYTTRKKKISDSKKAGLFIDYLIEHPNALLIIDGISDLAQLMGSVDDRAIRDLPCYILAISRQQIQSPKLLYPNYKVACLEKQDASKLFESYLSQGKAVSFSVTEQRVIQNICRKLGNLPEALVRAARYINDKSLDLQGYRDLLLLNDMEGINNDPLKPIVSSWPDLDDESQMVLKLAAYLCGNETSLGLTFLERAAELLIQKRPVKINRLPGLLEILDHYSLLDFKTEKALGLNPVVKNYAVKQVLPDLMEASLIINLRILMRSKRPEMERRRAAVILTSLNWFRITPPRSDFNSEIKEIRNSTLKYLGASFDLPPLPIPIDETLEYLDLASKSLESDKNLRYVLEEGLDPLLRKDLTLKQRTRAYLLLGILHGKIYQNSGQIGQKIEANNAYQEANKYLKQISIEEGASIEYNNLAARIYLGIGNLLSMDAENLHSDPIYDDAIKDLEVANKHARNYAQDPILEAKVLKELSYNHSKRKNFTQSKLLYQYALDRLQDYIHFYAAVLESASLCHWEQAEWYRNKANQTEEQADKDHLMCQALEEYETALELTKDQLVLLERANCSVYELLGAHKNAADYLVAIDATQPFCNKVANFSNALIEEACEHYQKVAILAEQLGLQDIADEAYLLFDQYCGEGLDGESS